MIVALGARAPHLPLSDGTSTLDLFRDGYVLLGGPAADPKWSEATRSVRESTQIPIHAHLLSPADLATQAWSSRYGAQDLVVLVRPDGHVCWSAVGPADGAELRTALEQLTARR